MHDTFADPATALTLREVPEPQPGPGQVRVRMTMAAIHNHDLLTVSGDYGFKPELPARAGTEATGVVEALGEGVTHLSVGQRVTGSTFGVWAESFVANAASLTPVPDAIDDATAAQLLSMPMSALTLLDFLGVREGEWIAQNAAGGAVGRLVAQFARARGVHVLGLVRRSAAVAELAAAGIEHVVATDTDDWRTRVAEVTGGASILIGVDSVGGSATGELMSIIADGGRAVLFGGMASWQMEAAIGDVIFRGITIEGFWGSKQIPALAPERRAELAAELFTGLTSGAVTLPVEGVFPLAQIADAVAAHHRPGRIGKVLLRG